MIATVFARALEQHRVFVEAPRSHRSTALLWRSSTSGASPRPERAARRTALIFMLIFKLGGFSGRLLVWALRKVVVLFSLLLLRAASLCSRGGPCKQVAFQVGFWFLYFREVSHLHGSVQRFSGRSRILRLFVTAIFPRTSC